MKRRDFIKIVGGASLAPVSANAQRSERMRRIAILMPFPRSDAEMQSRVHVFREELRKSGWTPGVNVEFDERWTSDDMELIRSAAATLVDLKPDAILTIGARVIPVLMQTTRTVPIVIPGGANPVERHWIESLARPGGNVTGFSPMEFSVIGKMLQLLKELAPKVARVAMLYNSDNEAAPLYLRSLWAAAPAVSVQVIDSPIKDFADIQRAVAAIAKEPNSGIFIPPDVTITPLMEQTVALTVRLQLPTLCSERFAVVYGGLAFYGADRFDIYRRSASYVDRILRGERPGHLPYQQPTKYELIINLKTAKALGLTVPATLLAEADEVIE